ncbi:MAG: hypothetical protein OEL56_07205 [Nitrosopumilus sp.]|nr:hypothetical protein [Nitrosopumilus sp.]MDH3490221.1 hypothetical protein [Nitrosopumilus sp.]MDH3516959.1 hypothetical protein [Nitrosopumilus sp.]MDH3565334.1 hypothetical protein [Nitrosopumilus sp.]MDH5417006.1 hypothetical protein [Nitrosopumilus sp.]
MVKCNDFQEYLSIMIGKAPPPMIGLIIDFLVIDTNDFSELPVQN